MLSRRVLKAIIPVRSGSKRLKNKNIRPFCGSSLLEIRVQQLVACKNLDGVCVSSNDPTMLEIAAALGAETHLRDDYYASDSVPMSEVYRNMVSTLDCDDVLYATVTTPLVRSESYDRAIETYRTLANSFDSLSTVEALKEFMLRDGEPMNYNPQKFPRSQDLPNIQRLTFAISLIPRELMMSKKSSLGYRPYFLELSQEESIDIDTPLDFEICELLYAKRHAAKQL